MLSPKSKLASSNVAPIPYSSNGIHSTNHPVSACVISSGNALLKWYGSGKIISYPRVPEVCSVISSSFLFEYPPLKNDSHQTDYEEKGYCPKFSHIKGIRNQDALFVTHPPESPRHTNGSWQGQDKSRQYE